MGVLGLGTTSGGAGAVEIATTMEELGAAGVIGPLVEGFIASQVVPAVEADKLAAGDLAVVILGRNPRAVRGKS